MAKISGPLLDRIDLHIEVPAVKYKEPQPSNPENVLHRGYAIEGYPINIIFLTPASPNIFSPVQVCTYGLDRNPGWPDCRIEFRSQSM